MALVKLFVGRMKAPWRAARRFASDHRASVSVDFIISLPILLAVLVLVSEYGRVLQMRNTLDNAVADAARYLSRVEMNPDMESFPPAVVEIARGLISSRLSTDIFAISDPVVTEANGFTMVGISAAVGIKAPALGLLRLGGPGARDLDNGMAIGEVEGLLVTAENLVRYFGR